MADGVNNSTKKVELSDFIKQQKEQHENMNLQFTWPELCKNIPKCVLYRANQLRQIAYKGLGQCSYKVADEFLMFAVELLIDNKDTITNEQFRELQNRAENLTFEDAETMLQVIIIIREKFSETVSTNRSMDNIVNVDDDEGAVGGDVTLPNNVLGLMLQCNSDSANTSNTQVPHIPPTKNIDQNASLQQRNEEATEQLTTNVAFDKAEYEKKLDAYCENHSPIMSRQAVKENIIEIIQNGNLESDLIDFLGYEAMDFAQYIVENQECIVASDSDLVERKNAVLEEMLTLLVERESEIWEDVEKLLMTCRQNESKRGN
ncbi:hypothetical protein K0M31_015159 [Melipona bicolor]|uniref:Uncharacterized protein n=1 Tax=Melipona bicolor TaxID=60889 RepID=A0AA40KFI5_9HYME|nr:hypothetical protein K0M31_015159 [Melipona bicolor]